MGKSQGLKAREESSRRVVRATMDERLDDGETK